MPRNSEVWSDFVSKLYEEQQMAQGIQQLAAESQALDFLNDEEDLYTEADLREGQNSYSGFLTSIPFLVVLHFGNQ